MRELLAHQRLALGALTIVFGLTGCQPDTPPAPLQNGLIYCSEGNPESFNPQLDASGTTVDATAAQLYDRLIDYDPESKRFVPALATKWQALDNGTRYRFTLRQHVAFHKTAYFTPSRTFNADDVVFSFNRWLKASHPYHDVNGGTYPFFTATGLDKLITDVERINAYTVDIKLARPDSSFLANLATDFPIILSAEYAQQQLDKGHPENIDRFPIGTGPFKFVEYRKDILIRYLRNENYWRQPPEIEQLVYSITPNANKRMLKLLTRECDVIPYPLVNELTAMSQEENIRVLSEVSPNVAFWAFNTQHPPFDDPRVRRALSHAINRAAIVQAIYFGNAQLARSILPPTSWAYTDVNASYQYDPAKARALLKEAGYANGFSMDIWAMPVQRVYNPNAQRMAELMQADLAQVGVEAHIISYEWNTFRRRLAEGEHDSVLIGWYADNADPDNFFRPLLSCAAVRTGSNRANWCNKSFDELLIKAISVNDNDARAEIYRQAQQVLREQQPLLPIAHSVRYQAQQDYIHGVKLPPYGGISFRNASKDLVKKAEDKP
ncbi:peptide ABC transporter substrate-binding protein SapA [Idiomarina tyrosinivorans]|uniref:Peptide ABC transporter substrate-binding protein SapA n=1 Tax=Idiomarina tyrosinivorans TaxID=1445662 RepID=A0A432ZRU9_9GAMM|nr:ABC transporter substrate-binding protein SapA [Idiomarina tyrosinivorans]RUO80627.1 peptide ABC transporter substrate-binding protein SapA [Idiomarina tyrosinivorans]